MRKLRSILAAVMAVMLILTAVPFTAAASNNVDGFTDFPTGWSAVAMREAVQNGLLSGFGDGTIRPQDRLTRAQIAAMINRAFGAEIKADIAGKFGDVNPGDWFYDDIAKAVNMKTFNGDADGNMRPNDPITREDAIVVISRALVVSSMSTDLLRNYNDSNTIDGYAQEAVCAFLDRGYIRGYEDMTLRGHNYITREEFAQIMDNIFANYVRVGGEIVLGNSEGEVVITGDNIGAGDTVRISSSYINGDLIIGDGLSTADIIIEDVDVTGRILFRGGEGTVTLKNVKLGTLIVTNDVNGTVNFMHYSDEAIFKNAVYNTPASFLDRTVGGGSASGNGRLNHDTTREGNEDAATGPKEKDDKKPIIIPGGGGSVTVYYSVTFESDGAEYYVKNNIRYNNTIELPTAPTKVGHTFIGWYYTDDAGNERQFTDRTRVTKSMTVTAKWRTNTYTVTFDPDNGEFPQTVTDIPYNTSVSTLPTAPTKTGYGFGGWFDADGNEFTASTLVTGNMTVKAKWNILKFTVTFKDGTAVIDTKTDVEYGSTVTLPADPTAPAGQTFIGWFYTEGGVERQFTAATPVTGDMTVYAKWEGTKYTVTFMDGTTEYHKITDVSYNATVALPTAPVKTGFVFDGWFDADGNEFTASTPVTANLTVTAKWIEAKYTVTFMDGATEYHKITDVAHGATVTLPTAPVKTGYTFAGWFDIHGNAFDATTAVYGDITVYAKWDGITYTVTFYEIDEERNKVENIASGNTVAASDITTATGNLDVAEEQGYVADKTNISATYDKDVNHKIPGAWYFKDASGKWQKFDETVAIYADLDVYYLFRIIKVHANLSSYLGHAGNIPVDIPYIDDTTAYESVLDGLYLANSKVVAAMNVVMNKLYGKTVSYGGTSYTPVGTDGKINTFEYDYRLIKLLGEATIRSYTEDAIKEMVMSDKALLIDAVKTVASHLDDTASGEYTTVVDYLKTTDGTKLLKSLMTNNDSFWIDYLVDDAQGRELLKAYLRSQGYSDMAIELFLSDPANAKEQLRVNKAGCIEYIVSNDAALDRVIKEACKEIAANDTIREDFAEDAATAIQESASKDAAFVERVVEVASNAYDDKIEEFIDSLKNSDRFVVDYDRKFIVLALSKKLHNTTYEEVKAKLPSAVGKVLDDNVMRDIYNTTIDAYRTQVDAVKAVVTDAAYDGTAQYIDTFCHITVDPITQVLKPEYDRFFVNKLDPAIKDNKYYGLNPYIKEIENLLKVESIVDERTDGYYVRSAQDYYDLLYKLAVLSVDTGDWFAVNVPETELDAAIDTASKRIGGYLDRLVAKFTFLQNGKVEEARNRGEELVRKLIDKNTSELWNSKTEVLFTEKLPVAYEKAEDMIMDKLGFNVENPVIVTVASDYNTVTVTDGSKTVIKSLSELLKTYADGKKGISVSGTVITFKGKSVDAKRVVEKLVAKFGSTFTVKVEHSTVIFGSGIEIEDGYKLSVNGDYIAVAKQYK